MRHNYNVAFEENCRSAFFFSLIRLTERAYYLVLTVCLMNLNIFKKTLQQNGYYPHEICKAFSKFGNKSNMHESSVGEHMKGIACIPYYSSVSNKIGSVLIKHGIETIFKPLVKIQHMLKSIKNILGLRCMVAYHIPCKCESNYIGQMEKFADQWDVKSLEHNQSDKSGLVQHVLATGHNVQFIHS